MQASGSDEAVARAFELLGVSPDCTRDELRHAFARGCRLFHPDRHAGACDEVRAAANERMGALNDAHATARRSIERRACDPRGAVERPAVAATTARRALSAPSSRPPSSVRVPTRWASAMQPGPLLGWMIDLVA